MSLAKPAINWSHVTGKRHSCSALSHSSKDLADGLGPSTPGTADDLRKGKYMRPCCSF